jgi:PQQ-dependent catabolism-associated CXXCW motif protein
LWAASCFIAACATPHNPEEPGISASECQQVYDVQTDYRTQNYRAPTPPCTPFGTTLTTRQLQLLITQKPNTALIDVLGVTHRPEMDEFDSAWLPSRPRFNLKGSHWLPNVGYAELNTEMRQYFSDQMQRITQSNPQHPVVIYCIVDCWLSWNAIKRAHKLGYSNLFWYPDGTDGWSEQQLPLVESTPIPIYPNEKL